MSKSTMETKDLESGQILKGDWVNNLPNMDKQANQIS